jgi:hypothetical protein
LLIEVAQVAGGATHVLEGREHRVLIGAIPERIGPLKEGVEQNGVSIERRVDTSQNGRFLLNRDVVLGAGQPPGHLVLVRPELAQALLAVLEVQEHGAVHPLQAVDHVLRRDDAPVVFAQNGLRSASQVLQVREGPRQHETQQE